MDGADRRRTVAGCPVSRGEGRGVVGDKRVELSGDGRQCAGETNESTMKKERDEERGEHNDQEEEEGSDRSCFWDARLGCLGPDGRRREVAARADAIADATAADWPRPPDRGRPRQ